MRSLISIIGDRNVADGTDQAKLLVDLGHALVSARYRIITGGLGDLPKLVASGARDSPDYTDGDLIAILPGHDPTEAVGVADIVLPTGLDVARNVLVASADAVIAVGGGAGTLSEAALAWQLHRPILGWTGSGWSKSLAGKPMDHRSDDGKRVEPFGNAAEATQHLQRVLGAPPTRHRGIR